MDKMPWASLIRPRYIIEKGLRTGNEMIYAQGLSYRPNQQEMLANPEFWRQHYSEDKQWDTNGEMRDYLETNNFVVNTDASSYETYDYDRRPQEYTRIWQEKKNTDYRSAEQYSTEAKAYREARKDFERKV